MPAHAMIKPESNTITTVTKSIMKMTIIKRSRIMGRSLHTLKEAISRKRRHITQRHIRKS